MIGCASSRPIIGESSNHESDHRNTRSHVENTTDSTIIDRLREVIVRNDTVYIHDSIYIEKWRERQVKDTIHDTLYINHTDTIRRIITNEVEKPIAPFVRNSCIALWVIVGVAFLSLVVWIVWKFATGKVSFANILSKILRK